MPQQNTMGLLSKKTCLLVADFEINAKIYKVIIDTGATISLIPEYGAILKESRLIPRIANLNVKLADGTIIHIHRKFKINLKPARCDIQPIESSFYVQPSTDKILGYEALIGLNCLKKFDLNISIRNGRVTMSHENKTIGYESLVNSDVSGSIHVDDRVEGLNVDTRVGQLLKSFRSVFTELDDRPIHGDPMRIITTHNRPIFSKQRHYSPSEAIQMKEHISQLLKKGLIEPSSSGYAATSRIIPKKNGTGRLVINYIPLNAVTLRDSYTVPHVSDIFAAIQGAEYFSTMDCAQGFYQIAIDERDRHKTGFSSPLGNFQFTRCPFGARNSGAFFQRQMNNIFFDGLFTKCIIYIDDIIIFGRTRSEHDENLGWVLARCREFNIKIKLEKCHFAKKEVEFLGYIINGHSIRPMPNKIDSICSENAPKDKTQLRSMIGKLNFYSRFVENFAEKLEPLRELFRQNKDFQWKSYHQQALDRIRTSLRNATEHGISRQDSPKTIELQVFDSSLEMILLDHNNKLMNRYSRLLSQSEANYSLTEKFLLSLVTSINKFRIWISPENLIIRLPIKDLEKTLKLINRPERVDNLLLKLPCGYDSFQFEVMGEILQKRSKQIHSHVPQEVYYVDGACRRNGKPDCKAAWAVCAEFDRSLEERGFVEESPSNNCAEVMAAIKACLLAKERGQTEITIITDSKYLHSAATLWIDKWCANDWKDHKNKPVVNTDLFKQLIEAKRGIQVEWIHVKGHLDNVGNIRADGLARGLLEENMDILGSIIHHARTIQNDSEATKLKESIVKGEDDRFVVKDGIIFFIDDKLPEEYNERIYVPESNRKGLLYLAHDDIVLGGHLGVKKTHRKLIRYWWPGIYRDVERYVQSCHRCQEFKNPVGLPPGCLHNIPISRSFERIHIDIVGPIRPTCRGNSYIITAIDAFSKWAFAQPFQSVTTSTVIKFVEECIIAIHGKPEIIVSDRGPQFTSHEWSRFVGRLGINHNLTTPYHPQSNGTDERFNGTIVRILRAYANDDQSDWDIKLKWALYVYNTTVHESTGYSPYQALHGLEPRSPLKGSQSDTVDVEKLDKIRENIRADMHKNIKVIQEKQKVLYDKHRRPCELKLGQLVMAREFTSPSGLSKKLFPNWYGPLVVVGFVGDDCNPKAVELLDIKHHSKRILAIQDVKRFIARDNPDETLNWINGSTSFCDNDRFTSPGYYLDVDEPVSRDETGHNENNQDQRLVIGSDETDGIPNSQSFDVVDRRLTTQPMSSSPRRVTINEDVRVHEYPLFDSIEATPEKDQLPKSPYVCNIQDDRDKDPTFSQPVSRIPKSDRVLRSQTRSNSQ